MTLFEVNEIEESYFQEIDYHIKILGLFRYDREKEQIVISQKRFFLSKNVVQCVFMCFSRTPLFEI